MSLHQNDKLFPVYEKRCLVSRWPPASEFGMLLVTTFVELCVVAGRSRTRAGSPQVVSRRPMLIHIKTHSKPLAARHSRGTAWAQHTMCELAFKSIICSRCECKVGRYGSHILAGICCCEIWCSHLHVLVIREVHSSIVLGEKHGLAVIFSTALVYNTSVGHMSVIQCGISRFNESRLCGTDSVLLLLEFVHVLQSKTAVLCIWWKFVWIY
jgi:hypothetical protein